MVPQKKSEHYFIKSKCLQYETNVEIFKYGIGVHVYLSIFDEGFFLLLFQGFKRVHAPVNGNCCEDTSDRAIFNANPRELSSLIVIKVIIA